MIRPRNVEVVATATQLRIFLPAGAGGKSTEWIFKRVTNATMHLDKWCLNLVYAAERTGDYTYVRRLGGNSIISDNSTWEHAIQCQTAGVNDAEFSGGIAHGWQKLTSVMFFVDGRPWTPATGNVRGRNIRVVQECNLYRYKPTTGESEDLIARTTEIFDFSSDGLTLNQSVRFAAAVTIGNAYLGMWPLIRSVAGSPFYQITSRAVRNNDGVPEDISADNHAHKFTAGTTKVQLWDPDSEMVADWQQTIRSGSEQLVFISGSPAYNKLYCQACPNGATVTSSTVWNTEHKFRIST